MINLMIIGIYWEKNANKTQDSPDFYTWPLCYEVAECVKCSIAVSQIAVMPVNSTRVVLQPETALDRLES